MKPLIALFSVVALTLGSVFTVRAEPNAPNLSGLAAYEQLRKEYYIGGLYLGWPGHDAATILAMPGKRQMELRITADRWPALRFAQMWNQGVTINNDGATLNANAVDFVAFTSILKGDLVEGDQLVIETEPNAGTRVTLNGVLVLHTKNVALFNLLLNSWIGSRPPSSEFKRDILTMPASATGISLTARFEAIRPNDARKKAIAAWGIKPELEATPAALPAVAISAAKTPEVVTARSEPLVAAHIPAAAPIPAAPTPATATTPAPSKPISPTPPPPPPKPSAEPVKIALATPQPEPPAQAAAQQAKADKEKAQTDLYDEYLGQIRKQVLRRIEYPRRASKEGIEGLVMLRIVVDREGNVAASEITQSAHDLLDSAAENAVKKATPFPKAPEQLEGNQFPILIPVVFKLTQ